MLPRMSRQKIILNSLLGTLVLLWILVMATGSVKIFEIPSRSMSPTIQPGDRILATRIFKPADTVKRGDLVVFDSPATKTKSKWVQRAVAIGGDRVEVIGGRLHVSGSEIPERGGLKSEPAKEVHPSFPPLSYPLTVPPGKIFTLGDNYGNSLDGRYFGPIPVETVSHSADRIVSPFHRTAKLK